MGGLMKRLLLAFGILTIAACSGPGEKAFDAPISASSKSVSDWSLRAVRVTAPKSLSVSTDPNERYPKTKIVWWEDAPGDRHAQVERIVKDAVQRGAQQMRGNTGVFIDVQVLLFHAVTPRARQIGRSSWHDISLSVAVRDQRSGEVLANAVLQPDLDALHGEAAAAAVARGETQKARISRQIAAVVQQWLVSSGADFTRRMAVAKPVPVRTRRSPAPQRTARRTVAPVAVAVSEPTPDAEEAPAIAADGGVVAEVSANVDGAQDAVSVEVGLDIDLEADAEACLNPEDGEFCP